MLELLEYSRRKTAVQHGKRVVKTTKSHAVNQKVSSVTKERDEEISRCPLLTMIRNPHCMYYVPYMPDKRALHAEGQRPEFELPDWELDEQDRDQGGDGRPRRPARARGRRPRPGRRLLRGLLRL